MWGEMSSMKCRIICMVLLSVLLISFSAYAINFTPEETFNSVVVVYAETGVGSGFSIKENLVITNAHVVGDSKIVAVVLYDGTNIEGTVIKTDEVKDLALIRVDKSLVPLKISEESKGVGQEVYAIGAPKDMPYTLTKGIISALGRKIGQNTYIQIDASVNSGNSGGPLVNDEGDVLGIITLKASDAEGIGFALEASELLLFAENAEDLTDADTNEAFEQKDEELAELKKQIDFLKTTVIVLAVLLVVSLLTNLKTRVKKKKKDEYDFEIEIEE